MADFSEKITVGFTPRQWAVLTARASKRALKTGSYIRQLTLERLTQVLAEEMGLDMMFANTPGHDEHEE